MVVRIIRYRYARCAAAEIPAVQPCIIMIIRVACVYSTVNAVVEKRDGLQCYDNHDEKRKNPKRKKKVFLRRRLRAVTARVA